MEKDKDLRVPKNDNSSPGEEEAQDKKSLDQIFREEVASFFQSGVERSTQHKIVFI